MALLQFVRTEMSLGQWVGRTSGYLRRRRTSHMLTTILRSSFLSSSWQLWTTGACSDGPEPAIPAPSGIAAFSRTPLYREVTDEQTEDVGDRVLLANNAVILGDSAFAEAPWLRTPIGIPADRDERLFNRAHSNMHFRVEHAFGRLKWKFQGLKFGLYFKLDNCAVVVDACVALYNFILVHEGERQEVVHRDPTPTRNSTGRRPRGEAGGRGSAAPTRRSEEVRYLADSGFVQQDWGAPGSRADRARIADGQRRARQARLVNETPPPADPWTDN